MEKGKKALHDAHFIKKKEISENTYEMQFQIESKEFSFLPGQYVWIILPTLIEADTAGQRRAFSIASAPTQDGTFSIIFRARSSGYKKTLLQLPDGAPIQVRGPLGSSFLVNEQLGSDLVLIAAGVGIAPFLSIIRSYASLSYKPRISIINCNHSDQSAFLQKELREACEKNAIRYISTFEHFNRSILKAIPEATHASYFVSGSQGFVDTVARELQQFGVPQKHMHFEQYFPTVRSSMNQLFESLSLPQRYDTSSYRTYTHRKLLHIFVLISAGTSLLLGIVFTFLKYPLSEIVLLYCTSLLFTINYFLSKLRKDSKVPTYISLLLAGIIILWCLYTGILSGFIVYWVYFLPLITFYLLDHKKGIIAGTSYFATLLAIYGLSYINLTPYRYDGLTIILSMCSLFFMSVLGYFITNIIKQSQNKINTTIELSKIFRLAIECSSNHIIFTDINGQILFANKAAEETTGYSFSEMQNQTPRLWGGIMSADFYRRLWNEKKKLRHPFTGEINNVKKNGEIYRSMAHISPIVDEQNKLLGYIGTEENITVLTEQKEKLNGLLERFNLARMSAKIGVWEWDIPNNVITWDDQMYKLYGIKPEDFGGAYEAWQAGLHPDDKKPGDEAIQKALKGEKDFDTQFRVVWPDKSIHYIQAHAIVQRNAKGEPISMIGVNWDITHEKEQQRSLLQSEMIIRNTSEAIFSKNLDGIITSWNRGAERLYGYTEKEMIGQSVKKLIPEDNNDFEDIMERIHKGERIRNLETERVRKDGTKIAVSLNISPVKTETGEIRGVSVFVRDITHEKVVDKMKTEFISLASHQLRTPLSAMKWFLEMLISGDAGKLSSEQMEYITNINDSNERMISLVSSLLNVSRIESGRIIVEPHPTDMKKLIDSLIVELQPRIDERKQTCIVSVHSNLTKVSIDEKLIRNVYQNLLTNAIKYTPEGGELSVFVSIKDGEILSQVTDTGHGIPQEEQTRIFEKFFRASNVIKLDTEGNGLGLYLVKSIVESSGGKIWFESTPEKGTTFWFTLPLDGMKEKKGEVRIDS